MRMENGLGMIVLLGIAVVDLLPAFRLVQVVRALRSEELVARSRLSGVLGGVAWLFLAACFAAAIAVAIVTFFFMETGGSGIPLGMAMIGLPVAWLATELVFAGCFTDPGEAERLARPQA
jgi:hypothetical protein